jgi:mannosylglycoprotein endo-beta-mannosidase
MFWDILKEDLVKLFEEFYKGSLDLYRLNCAVMTLIPKVEEARDIKNFRPISLINCSLKFSPKF